MFRFVSFRFVLQVPMFGFLSHQLADVSPFLSSYQLPFFTRLPLLNDRRQLADLAGNDLLPHIHFLSQIYWVRHPEGRWHNGHCIFYER